MKFKQWPVVIPAPEGHKLRPESTVLKGLLDTGKRRYDKIQLCETAPTQYFIYINVLFML